MAIIRIRKDSNSEWANLPDPAYNGGYNVSIQDVDASTSGRDQSGVMHRDRVGVKRKLNLSWNNLNPTQVAIILRATSPVFFEVEYYDPLSSKREVRTMYAGDKSQPIYSLATPSGTIYSSVSVNLIER